jgi:hypothetical protein
VTLLSTLSAPWAIGDSSWWRRLPASVVLRPTRISRPPAAAVAGHRLPLSTAAFSGAMDLPAASSPRRRCRICASRVPKVIGAAASATLPR